METSALMGMNIAQLIVDDYRYVIEIEDEAQGLLREGHKEKDGLHAQEL